jgi:Cu/Ag efflux protein CusF
VRSALARLEHAIQNADFAPTTAQVEACETSSKPLPDLLQQWEQLKKTDLKALNVTLRQQNLAVLQLNTDKINHDVEDQFEMGDVD